MKTNMSRLTAVGIVSAAWLLTAAPALAHCDTLDGPLVAAAKTALEKQEITPVLEWIKPEHEAELKSAFARVLTVRAQGKEAQELVDQFFFETLVRLHREGEGAPYAGLKPAGTKLDPAAEAADQALDSGKADALIKTVTEEDPAGIRQRLADATEKKKHAEHNVEAGREFVADYVEFVHYVEALHTTATRTAQPHRHADAADQPPKTAPAHNH
jgi:hypothetical protein